jgi:hypothetical protein
MMVWRKIPLTMSPAPRGSCANIHQRPDGSVHDLGNGIESAVIAADITMHKYGRSTERLGKSNRKIPETRETYMAAEADN